MLKMTFQQATIILQKKTIRTRVIYAFSAVSHHAAGVEDYFNSRIFLNWMPRSS